MLRQRLRHRGVGDVRLQKRLGLKHPIVSAPMFLISNKEMIVAAAEAEREGVRISFDMFPYTAAATMMIAIYPPWALEGGVEALAESQ